MCSTDGEGLSDFLESRERGSEMSQETVPFTQKGKDAAAPGPAPLLRDSASTGRQRAIALPTHPQRVGRSREQFSS